MPPSPHDKPGNPFIPHEVVSGRSRLRLAHNRIRITRGRRSTGEASPSPLRRSVAFAVGFCGSLPGRGDAQRRPRVAGGCRSTGEASPSPLQKAVGALPRVQCPLGLVFLP